MAKKNKSGIDWAKIDTVLLDMDGTLIDKHHDDFFWEELVPKCYAEKNNISQLEAKERLRRIYKTKENTKKWADFDYWSERLGINLWLLKDECRHTVKLHPHTVRFLKFLKRRRKKVYLVTAASRKDINFKLEHVGIFEYFDGIFSEIEIGSSKKEKMFWGKVQKKIKYEKSRTMLADDDETIMRMARSHGIRWLVIKSKSSSKKPHQISKEFFCVRHFDDIL